MGLDICFIIICGILLFIFLMILLVCNTDMVKVTKLTLTHTKKR